MFRWILLIALLWFIPWVPILYTGVLVYFPYEANGEDRFVRVTGPLLSSLSSNPEWVSSDDIPETCKSSLVAAEDSHFYEHWGIDTESIADAYKRNQVVGSSRYGGSTITQQLVKNAFLSRDKTYLRKVREVTGSLILDAIMSKERQLTWYFNVVEFGPKVYGLQAAAKYYYKKNAKNLSTTECVSLVSILQSPNEFSRYLKTKTPSRYLTRRHEHILKRIGKMKAGKVPAKV